MRQPLSFIFAVKRSDFGLSALPNFFKKVKKYSNYLFFIKKHTESIRAAMT